MPSKTFHPQSDIPTQRCLRFLFASFLSLVFLFSSCSKMDSHSIGSRSWMMPNGKIKILCTIAMIDDVVRRIGGSYVDSISLIKGELDPHSYQLVKGDDEKLAFADLIFYNGLGLEHGPTMHNFLKESPKAIGLGNALYEQQPTLILHQKGQLDPHIWMDVSLWMRTVPLITQALSSYRPDHASEFQTNADQLLKEMNTLHLAIKAEMHAIPASQRYLVTSHDAFNYFTRAYLAEPGEIHPSDWQKRFAAPEGLAPDSQLSSAEIQFIIDHLTAYQIHVLFPESNISKDSIGKIIDAGQQKGLRVHMATDVLYADAMGKPGSNADTYLKMMQHNATTIARYLLNNHP